MPTAPKKGEEQAPQEQQGQGELPPSHPNDPTATTLVSGEQSAEDIEKAQRQRAGLEG